MPALARDSIEAKRIDAALQDWRQGDLALDERWFVHVGDPSEPLTPAAAGAGGGDPQALTSEVDGLAVVSQTCDVVRSCCDRPYIEVAPLIQVGSNVLGEVMRGRRPSMAALPALAAMGLVVHIDRVMTVEKSIVARWKRTPGYELEPDGRAFAQALARKRARFAFPDEFTIFVRKLQDRLSSKHDQDTEEGRSLRALREIRVLATPSWDAAPISLFFWFIRHSADVDFDGKSWAGLLEGWLKLVPSSGGFVAVEGQVVTLEDMSGADYVGSDPLDLDRLSFSQSNV